MHTKYPLFQIFYSTTFTVLFIFLLCLLLITPGDIIRQTRSRGQFYDIFIVTGVYLVTLLLTIIIYASRLYTNRSVLAAIPKGWIPIDKDDVGRKVWRLIAEGLQRSVMIMRTGRPRDLGRDDEAVKEQQDDEGRLQATEKQLKTEKKKQKKRADELKDQGRILVDVEAPFWGKIEHPGWSAPATKDFPSLNYHAVVSELPFLVEAKAVSLVPLVVRDDDDDDNNREEDLIPDPAAVSLLQRAVSISMRDYIAHLRALDLIQSSSTICTDFVARYEQARFSGRDITEAEFRTLMNRFTEILRGMTHLSETMLARLEEDAPDGESASSSSPSSLRSRINSGQQRRRRQVGKSDDRNGTIRSNNQVSSSSSLSLSISTSSNSSSNNTRQWMITAPTTPFVQDLSSPSSSTRRSSSFSSSSTSSSPQHHHRHHPPTAHDNQPSSPYNQSLASVFLSTAAGNSSRSTLESASASGSVVRYAPPFAAPEVE